MSKLLNSKQVREALGNISSTTLWRYCKSGKLHPPLKPTKWSSYWKEEWVEEFISKLNVGEAYTR